MTTEKWEFSMKSQMGVNRLCGHHVDEHTDMKSIRTERWSDQSILYLQKAVPMEECNRANAHTMVRGDGVLEPLHLQLPRFEMVPKFLATLKGGFHSVNVIQSPTKLI